LPGMWADLCVAIRCDAFGIEEPPPVDIALVPTLPEDGGSSWRGRILSLEGRPLDADQKASELREQLANQLVDHWALNLTRTRLDVTPDPSSDKAWLEGELRSHLASQLDDDLGGSNFFDAILASDNLTSLRRLFMAVEGGPDDLRLTLQGRGTGFVRVPKAALQAYLAHRLRSEARLDGDRYANAESQDPSVVDFDLLAVADPSTIEVVDLLPDPSESVLWAEVVFQRLEPTQNDPNTPRVAYEPFAFIDGRWQRLNAQPNFFGPVLEEQGEMITLRYTAIDQDAIPGLLVALEARYDQVLSRLALAQLQPQVFVSVSPYNPGPLWEPADDYPAEFVHVAVRSPFSASRPVEQSRRDIIWAIALGKLEINIEAYATGGR
ncbi:MAG: hypothetical protein GYB68_09270, partial [Chloroflexi bacterium]|nr:hypothetical protein [Chloroflexota bacterium]